MSVNSSTERAGLILGQWWTVLLSGLAAVAFGVLAFVWPHITIHVLILLFGCYALVHGALSLVSAITGRTRGAGRGLPLLEGVVGIVSGIVALRNPSTTAMLLIFCLWVWAVATGFLRIAEAVLLRKLISGEIWLALSGILAAVFAVMLLMRPIGGPLHLAWMIAGFALLFGLFEILLGRELRGVWRRGHARGTV